MLNVRQTSRDVMGTLRRILQVAFIGVVIGGLASTASLLFVSIYKWLNNLLFVSRDARMLLQDYSYTAIAVTILVPTIGGLVVGWICNHLVKQRRALGPTDVIAVTQTGQSEMDVKNGFLSSTASLVSLGSGASVGQYGPLVHLGATLGSALRSMGLTMRAGGNVTIGCGVAAAISTVFNAPIAGIVFAHEVVLRHFSLRAFAPITVASTMGFIIANVVFETPPFAALGAFKVEHVVEFLFFALIGVLGALVAVVFMQLIFQANKLANNINIAQALKPAVAGFVLGLAAIFVPDILGTGADTINDVLSGNAPVLTYLAILVVAKTVATALCIGFGFAGGVFSPALMIGVTFGALIGVGVDTLIPNYYAGAEVYAICGMVAVTSPVIGAPLTTILIVFELTRNYDAATAAMIAAVFSNLVSYRLFGRSLFDKQLLVRGTDLSMGREYLQLDKQTIEPYISQGFCTACSNDSVKSAIANMRSKHCERIFISHENGHYAGSHSLAALLTIDEATKAQTLADIESESDSVSQNISVFSAMEQLKHKKQNAIAVTRSPQDKTLIGVIYPGDIIAAYLKINESLNEEERN